MCTPSARLFCTRSVRTSVYVTASAWDTFTRKYWHRSNHRKNQKTQETTASNRTNELRSHIARRNEPPACNTIQTGAPKLFLSETHQFGSRQQFDVDIQSETMKEATLDLQTDSVLPSFVFLLSPFCVLLVCLAFVVVCCCSLSVCFCCFVLR